MQISREVRRGFQACVIARNTADFHTRSVRLTPRPAAQLLRYCAEQDWPQGMAFIIDVVLGEELIDMMGPYYHALQKKAFNALRYLEDECAVRPGRDALILAVRERRFEVVEFLLSRNSFTRADLGTALIEAAHHNGVLSCRYLLQHNAPVHFRNCEALKIARAQGYEMLSGILRNAEKQQYAAMGRYIPKSITWDE